MNPFTHFFISWAVANTAELSRRDRALVTVSGIIPDIDGMGIIAEMATRHTETPIRWWSDYHHVFGHNFGFSLTMGAAVFLFAKRRRMAGLLAIFAFHLHLFCDIIGARGPDGYQWPIPYLLPFSDKWQLVWERQWALNAWPNFAITAIALGGTLYLAWKRGYSFLETVSPGADKALVRTLRNRFGASGR